MVRSIYRVTPAGTREYAQPNQRGFYRLVDRRIPMKVGAQANFRNLARVAVSAASLDEAWALIALDYGIRIKTASGLNYVYDELESD